MNLKIFFLASLVFHFVAELVLFSTSTTHSRDAIISPSGEKVVFHGTRIIDGKIVDAGIFIKNFQDSTEFLVESMTIFPAIGWIDSESILIYKVVSELGKKKRGLFIHNVVSDKVVEITEIPLVHSKSRMSLDENIIVYQTGHYESTRLFQYDVMSKKTSEYTLLANRNIGDGDFCFRKRDNSLAFVEKIGDSFYLKIFRNDSIRTIAVSGHEFKSISFDFFSNRLFYVERQLLKNWRSENWWTLDILRFFDTTSGESSIVYEFMPDVMCGRVSGLSKNRLMLSLSASQSETHSTTVLPGINVSSTNGSHLYLLTYK